MGQPIAKAFASSLTEAIYRIRLKESKSVRTVQDELGYALGKKGGASIEYWRKGHLPVKLSDIEQLAREIVLRSDLDALWLQDFLQDAGHPEPERVCQNLLLLSYDVPSKPAADSVVAALPVDTTLFIGRKQELENIAQNLADPSCRILTLMGPGGIGKTRLAVQAASECADLFPDGVFLAPLAAVDSPHLLLLAVANAVGFSFYSEETAVSQLLSYLRHKQLLLILDNFEHLLDGVGLLVQILQQAPAVQLLVTSRERLNLRGEWAITLNGLTFPVVENPAAPPDAKWLQAFPQYSAIQLFMQSAQRARSDFMAREQDKPYIARICQLVQGIPLGIELAASWVRVLSCRDIATEIEQSYEFLATRWHDVPERHRSLQAVFDYSWDLLAQPERELVQQLAVFQGGFRRAAATAVTQTSLLQLLLLVDKSFLQQTMVEGANTRYHMHELLRLYALEKLRAQGDPTAVQQRHCAYYANFLEGLGQALYGPDQASGLETIGEEIENIRAAWQWAIDQGEMAAIEQLLLPLFDFYDIRGWLREGHAALQTAVAHLRHQPQTPELLLTLGRALARQGQFLFRLGQYHQAIPLLQEGLTIFRERDRPQDVALLLNMLGRIAYRRGDYPEAAVYCLESLDLCQRIDHPWGMVNAFETLGHCATDQGDYDLARRYHQQGLDRARQVGDQRAIASLLNGLGYTNWRLGEYQTAAAYCQESLQIFRQIGDRWGSIMALKNLGNIAGDQGDNAQALALYAEGLALSRAIGFRWGEAALLNNQGNIALIEGDYHLAKQLCTQSVATWREIGYQYGIAGSLETLGNVAIMLAEYDEARAYFREAVTTAVAIDATPMILEVFVGVSRLYAQVDELAQALSLLVYVKNHPALDQEGKNKATSAWEELWAEAPPAVRAHVQAQNTRRHMQDVLTAILTKLT
ncbi:MAG: tetratricopeptide repeat protein [Anaerolinea sp.]|nr:tetratricopeptide repeat protein [Anaerolinea sp.]